MIVNEKNTVVAKDDVILPGDHLSKAKYTDVIERQLLDGNFDEEHIKLCVSSNVEMRKCKTMSDAAFSRDIRPIIECVLKDNEKCVEALNHKTVDAIIVQMKNFETHDLKGLKGILFEQYDDDDKYVIVAEDGIEFNEIKTTEL